MDTWLAALVAAIVIAAVLGLVQRSRNIVLRGARRAWSAVSPRQQNARALAIERIAVELADRRCQDEGNPDDEFPVRLGPLVPGRRRRQRGLCAGSSSATWTGCTEWRPPAWRSRWRATDGPKRRRVR